MTEGIGIRVGKACDEQCDVCSGSLKRGTHVIVETSGYLLKFCKRCAKDIGETA